MKKSRLLVSVALAVGAVALFAGAADVWAQGCAMCQASLPGAEDPLAHGFNYSIYMFLGVTYSLFILGGGFIGFTYWRASAPSRSTSVLAFQTMTKEEQS